jgi:ketosteroid isomerase-like protein
MILGMPSRFSLLLVGLLCFVHAGLLAQPKNESLEKQEIKKVLTLQLDAWNRGDLEGFMTGYWHDDSLIFVSKKGITYGWDQVFENYRKSYPNAEAMGFLAFDILGIEVVGLDNARVTGGWRINKSGTEPGGYFTLLFRKTTKGWKIFYDHTS